MKSEKIISLFTGICIATFGFSQVYEAQYICYLNNTVSIGREATDSTEARIMHSVIGGRSKFVYLVKAGAKAMEIKGFADSVPSVVPVHANNSEMLVNLVSSTVYFPEGEGFKKLRYLVSDSVSSGGETCYIKGYPRNYYFMVNPKLPATINPGFFVKNCRGAITKLVTPVFEMELLRVKKQKGTLGPSPVFKNPAAQKLQTYYSLID
jgi:hypothetical protein